MNKTQIKKVLRESEVDPKELGPILNTATVDYLIQRSIEYLANCVTGKYVDEDIKRAISLLAIARVKKAESMNRVPTNANAKPTPSKRPREKDSGRDSRLPENS